MTREGFFQWLDTCPSTNWEVVEDDYGNTIVSFAYDELPDEPETDNDEED